MDTNTIHTGDAFDVLPELPDESIHAVVTDPPYGLAFMGRDWDDFEPKEYQEWSERWACEVKRVLKPGGHLLAFSGNRTHHRLFTGVEDAGFKIRDTLTWHYGSGFPKASDISKTIDKRADAEREVIAVKKGDQPAQTDTYGGFEGQEDENNRRDTEVTAPATDAAKKWDGWKTGLKPATEFVVMARKPYDGATVDSVLENGTGALNIDACRIESDGSHKRQYQPQDGDGREVYDESLDAGFQPTNAEGRYPANVVFDETAADALDREVGESSSNVREATGNAKMNPGGTNSMREMPTPDTQDRGFNDSGGPSRYFYTSKASRSERTNDGAIENDHPTVKPSDLIKWLIKLVTREGQTVLDPFAGSGTTCMAAKGLGREFVGIERQDKWADVARVRCGLTPDDPSVVRGDDDQNGLEAYADGGKP